VPFVAPEEHRDGDLLLRPWRPGDGEEVNRATVASYEHLRRFMAWPSPDTTVEDSEGYVRQCRARWLLGEQWDVGVWRDGRLVAGSGFMSGNLASARVAEKCGFQLEGRLRENGPAASGGGRQTTLLFGLVRSDPRPWRTGG
jgi:hypothetical protein